MIDKILDKFGYGERITPEDTKELKPTITPDDTEKRLKEQLQTMCTTNVFSEEDFKKQFSIVFNVMGNILANTLGPYGSSTIIDEQKNFSVTKDGFHVLQNLRFADTKQNRIYTTLYAISHQMVVKVGDGSTSAVVAANEFLKQMIRNNLTNSDIRPKEWNEIIQKNVNLICERIAKSAIPISEKNLVDVVRNITNIATNENKTYTDIITNIYKEFGTNCTINYTNSDTFEDGVEYKDGIYTTDAYLVDRLFCNRGDYCQLTDCDVLMFDHTLDIDIWEIITTAFNKFTYQHGRTLIIIAPFYNQILMDQIRKESEAMVRLAASNNSNRIGFRMVFLKASQLHKQIYKDMYADLASLFGATIYKPADTKELIEKWAEYNTACREEMAKGSHKPPDTPEEIVNSIKDHIGFVKEATLGAVKTSSFKGFDNINQPLFDKMLNDAKMTLEKEEQRVLETDSVDNAAFDARTRYTKISCKSATIKIGGSNRLEMSINSDAVDDAVKAVASAIKYGYNQGCNLSIVKAVDELLKETKDWKDELILKEIKNAFLHVYRRVLTNGMSDEKADEILNKSIEMGYIPYNMATKEFDTEMTQVINSCRTDIEILRGAIAMVGLVLTCNQYVSSTLNH